MLYSRSFLVIYFIHSSVCTCQSQTPNLSLPLTIPPIPPARNIHCLNGFGQVTSLCLNSVPKSTKWSFRHKTYIIGIWWNSDKILSMKSLYNSKFWIISDLCVGRVTDHSPSQKIDCWFSYLFSVSLPPPSIFTYGIYNSARHLVSTQQTFIEWISMKTNRNNHTGI